MGRVYPTPSRWRVGGSRRLVMEAMIEVSSRLRGVGDEEVVDGGKGVEKAADVARH